MRIDRSVVLVTGASSPVGRAAAGRLASLGARLVLVGPDAGGLEETARSTRGRIVVADLAEPGAPEWVAEEAVQAMGRVDVLVNDAGQGWVGRHTSPDEDELERLVSVNLLAPLRLTRALLPAMLDSGRGRIVNVTAVPAAAGEPAAAAHAAAEAALVAFTESLRDELAGTGVSAGLVTAALPGGLLARRRRTAWLGVRGRRWAGAVATRRVADAVAWTVAEPRAELFAGVPLAGIWLGLPERLRLPERRRAPDRLGLPERLQARLPDRFRRSLPATRRSLA